MLISWKPPDSIGTIATVLTVPACKLSVAALRCRAGIHRGARLRGLTERECGTGCELSVRRETTTARHSRRRVEETHACRRVYCRRIAVPSACGGEQRSREKRH